MPAERISVIRLPWMTMSRGPCTVPPDPSMTFTPRMTSFVNGPLPFVRPTRRRDGLRAGRNRHAHEMTSAVATARVRNLMTPPCF